MLNEISELLQGGNQTASTDTIIQIIVLLVALLVMALLIYIVLYIFGEKQHLDGMYLLKLMLIAVIIVVLIIATGAVVGALDGLVPSLSSLLGLAQMVNVLAFLVCSVATYYLLIPTKDAKKAIIVTFCAFCAFYGFNFIANSAFGFSLLSIAGF